MRIADVELERMYWQKWHVKPVRAPRYLPIPKRLPAHGVWYQPTHSWNRPCGTFSGWHVLRRVLVEHRERGRLHIIRFEWRMNDRRQWRLYGVPDTCTAASLERPVDVA